MATTNNYRKGIGLTLKKARQQRCYSMYKAAQESRLTIGQIKRIEEGKENYTVDLLDKLAAAYNMAVQVIRKPTNAKTDR